MDPLRSGAIFRVRDPSALKSPMPLHARAKTSPQKHQHQHQQHQQDSGRGFQMESPPSSAVRAHASAHKQPQQRGFKFAGNQQSSSPRHHGAFHQPTSQHRKLSRPTAAGPGHVRSPVQTTAPRVVRPHARRSGGDALDLRSARASFESLLKSSPLPKVRPLVPIRLTLLFAVNPEASSSFFRSFFFLFSFFSFFPFVLVFFCSCHCVTLKHTCTALTPT